jgi:hypothetical protein
MRRSLVLGLSLSVILALPAGAQRLVLSIDGDWWDSNGQALGFASPVGGRCVFGRGGSLQVVDAQTKAANTYVFEKMGAQCMSSCPRIPKTVPESSHCADTQAEPQRQTADAGIFSGFDLKGILNRLLRSPQMYIVAAARGVEEEPQEAVLRVSGSEVDLGAALQGVDAGAYAMTLEPVGEGGTPVNGKVHWAPGSPGRFEVGTRRGLYRLSVAVEGGESEGSEAWVLLSPSPQYEADAKEFQQAVALTKSWGDRVDTAGKRALLRACLQGLAERDAGKSK